MSPRAGPTRCSRGLPRSAFKRRMTVELSARSPAAMSDSMTRNPNLSRAAARHASMTSKHRRLRRFQTCAATLKLTCTAAGFSNRGRLRWETSGRRRFGFARLPAACRPSAAVRVQAASFDWGLIYHPVTSRVRSPASRLYSDSGPFDRPGTSFRPPRQSSTRGAGASTVADPRGSRKSPRLDVTAAIGRSATALPRRNWPTDIRSRGAGPGAERPDHAVPKGKGEVRPEPEKFGNPAAHAGCNPPCQGRGA